VAAGVWQVRGAIAARVLPPGMCARDRPTSCLLLSNHLAVPTTIRYPLLLVLTRPSRSSSFLDSSSVTFISHHSYALQLHLAPFALYIINHVLRGLLCLAGVCLRLRLRLFISLIPDRRHESIHILGWHYTGERQKPFNGGCHGIPRKRRKS
jgi:hypothetical protein